MAKNLPASEGDARDMGSIPGLGRSLRRGHGNPLQYSCLGNSVDRGAWWATVHGVAKSQTWLSDWASHILKAINRWGTLMNGRRLGSLSSGQCGWRRTRPVALDPPPPTWVLFLPHQGPLAGAVKTIVAMRLKPATADDSCSFSAQTEKPGLQS